MTTKNKKSTVRDWLIILVVLLDDIAALGLVFLLLWYFEVKIPWPLMTVVGIAAGTFIFILHRAVIPSLHLKKLTGTEAMIGTPGEVVKPLKPEGLVRVKGEYWQAKSTDGNIEAGESVEIVRIEGLKLEVRRKA